ncbi:hypothetical protein GCM10023189_26910 [Nibrella saemangeumensis]|uniref:OmpA-like domain-containing protein n=1 Tax=Nibrella saemangeumensis TaxID=1084526 RepID=A0ABP8MVP6_9BACT
MKTTLLWLCMLVVCPLWVQAQVQYVTERPRVEEVNDPDVSIRRIELTDRYTIIYMTFYRRSQQAPPYRRQSPNRLPFPFPQETIETTTINFQPSSRLYADRGERSFRFIRAENIPVTERRGVRPGEQVDFVVYFERLEPGIEVFDLFECNDSRGNICFNFYGVHVNNPLRRQPQQQPQAQRQPQRPAPRTPAPEPRVEEPPVAVSPSTPEPVAPATVTIKGVIRDAKTKKPVLATVSYQLLTNDRPLNDTVRNDWQNGSYRIAARPISIYAVSVTAKGYLGLSDTLTTTRTDLVRDMELIPIEAGAKITLRNIYFDVSKYDLRSESFPELDQLVSIMRENPTMKIRLEGHTDIVGDFDANVELSRNRVKEVKNYLVSKGINAGRIDTVGYGASRPINKNATMKERQENRRVEMVITQK